MKSPAFQLYAGDFMSDPNVDAMEPEELGGYFRLLLVAWQQDEPGYLPNDEAMLARWSRLGARWKECGPAILRCWRTAVDGRLFQKRMVEVAAEQAEYREQQRSKGLLSAKARKDKKQPQPRLNSGCAPVATERQPDTQPEGNPPSSSPSSSEKEKDTRAGDSLPSVRGFAAWWGAATGESMPDSWQIGDAYRRVTEYATSVDRPVANVADEALAAFRFEVESWDSGRPLTAALFNRKWSEIQVRMAGKVPTAKGRGRSPPEPKQRVYQDLGEAADRLEAESEG